MKTESNAEDDRHRDDEKFKFTGGHHLSNFRCYFIASCLELCHVLIMPTYMTGIKDIQIIGNEIAVKWTDNSDDFFKMDRLRALSPSAETQGERDLLGNAISGDEQGKDFTGVTVTGWAPVGGYGLQFKFSDGHNTGIYSFDYLKEIAAAE